MTEMNDRSLHLMEQNLNHVEKLLQSDSDTYEPLLLQIDIMMEVLAKWLVDAPNIKVVDQLKLEAIEQKIENLEKLLANKLSIKNDK